MLMMGLIAVEEMKFVFRSSSVLLCNGMDKKIETFVPVLFRRFLSFSFFFSVGD